MTRRRVEVVPEVAVPCRSRSTAGSAGFTLIELLVVVLIIAVIIGAGAYAPHMMAPESGLSAGAEKIATTIDDARNQAILAGRIVWFEIELGEPNGDQHLRAILEPLPGKEQDAEDDQYHLTISDWQAIPEDIRIDSVVLGDGEPVTTGRVSIPIQADGTLPSHLIRLWSPELDPSKERNWGWASVQVAGLLGQARVLNRYVEPEFLRDETFQ